MQKITVNYKTNKKLLWILDVTSNKTTFRGGLQNASTFGFS